MSKFNTTQCKRSIEKTNTKQRISLSRRKTRQKKESDNSSLQQELHRNGQDIQQVYDPEDLPFGSTYPVKLEEEMEQITTCDVIVPPSIPESLTLLQETNSTIENMNSINANLMDDSSIDDIMSDPVLSTQDFSENVNQRSTLTDFLKHEYEVKGKAEYKNETDNDVKTDVKIKNEVKEEIFNDVKIKYEIKEETCNDLEFKVKEDQDYDIKVNCEEKYECPVCDVDLTFIISVELRQEHVMDCIASAQYKQEASMCIVCNQDITHLTINQRQQHVNRCLDGPTVTRYKRDTSNDFATTQPVFLNKRQKLPKPTREEDKLDDLYQATLVMSKSLQKPDKKVKIELDEANIWSNQESRQEASRQLSLLLDAQNEMHMSRQSEREASIGSLASSTMITVPTLILSQSASIDFWELAGLKDVDPLIYNCEFLSKHKCFQGEL